MAEPWIRVHANLAARPVIRRAVVALGVEKHKAMGLLVQFWGAVSQHTVNGDIRDVPDSDIEEWAGWKGKRGKFAVFVRSQHADAGGRVNEWDEYAGSLELRRAKDRLRQEERRRRIQEERERLSRGLSHGASRGGHADAPRDVAWTVAGSVTQESVPARAGAPVTRRDDTKRDERDTAHQSSSQPIRENALAERLPTVAGRNALAAVLKSAGETSGIAEELEMLLGGHRGQHVQPTLEQLDVALSDYVTNGMSDGRWNAAHFRGCIKRAMRPDDELRPNGGQRPTKTQQALSAIEKL